MANSISPDLVRKLKSVADPSLSPDGSKLAYTLAWVDQQRLESRSRIMMMQLEAGRTAEYTQGNKDTAPRFSPNGDTVAFLRSTTDQAGSESARQADDQGVGRRQVWLIPSDGGEATQLTTVPGGVIDFAWSPDSKRIVFCADVDPDATSADRKSSDGPRVRTVRRIRYRYDTLGWRGDAHFHLFLSDAAGGAACQLTDGDWDDTSPAWSPDGADIAFISGRGEDRDINALTEAYVVPAAGGQPRLWSEGLSSVGALAWSPDGSRLVAIGSEAPGYLVLWQGWLYILEPGKEPQRLTDDTFRPYLGFPTVSRSPEVRWTPDDRILLLGERSGESFLYQVSADSGEAFPLLGGGCQSTDLTLDKAALRAVVLSSSPSSPSDLYNLQVGKADSIPKQITYHNRKYMQEHPPAQLEKFRIERGGLQIECRLFRPHHFEPDRRYPLVLDIHGGPNGAFYDAFLPWQQVLAGAGYLVLAVNPRGSSTYGNDFMMAVVGDWGGEDYLDLMEAVDQVTARDYVAEDRLGVHGYSYGGYMSAWILGQTNRFRSAVVGAPCIDLFSMYGTSDIGVSFGEVQWGNSLADAGPEALDRLAAHLLQRSPITHAASVDTPVLLLHGEADVRCPIAQSEAYFTVLKRLGKEVEMVRFPDCSHLFPRSGHPRMREEYLARTLAWFDDHL